MSILLLLMFINFCVWKEEVVYCHKRILCGIK